LTDFENCETLFSVSNRIAGGTRLASRYHRHKRIDLFFDCWNDDAYSNLGSLLRRKYVNTLKVIETASSFIAKFPDLSDADLEKFFQEEVNYLASFKSGLPNDKFGANYVELLEQLEEKQSEFDELHSAAASNETDDKISDLRRNLTAMQLELKRRTVLDQLLNIRKSVEKIELERGIQKRWTRGSQEWIDAQQLRHSRQFYKCLDELEHLIVQRVVEMSRAGLANTNYKLRKHIVKSLSARSSAIKTALERYNKVAGKLDPPAPKIAYQKVLDTTILSEFEILRGSRRQVLAQAWTKPENRRCVDQYHRLLRAREEIVRLNIEVRRLSTSIADEECVLPRIAAQVSASNPALGWAAARLVSRRLATNKLILRELDTIRSMPGYSGWHSNSIRLGGATTFKFTNVTEPKSAEDQTQTDRQGSSDRQPRDKDTRCFVDNDLRLTSNQGVSEAQDAEENHGIEPDDAVVEQFERWQAMLEQASQASDDCDT
ncbi:hypothetical protein FRC09_010854, partial [Ceratobasidium sp. 395]